MHLRTRPAGKHHVGHSPLNDAGCLDHRQQAGNLALVNGVVWSPGVLGDGNMRGDHIRQHPQETQGKTDRQALGAPKPKIEAAVHHAGAIDRFAFLDLRTDLVGPKHNPEPLRIDHAAADAGVTAGERAGGNAQLRVARHHLQALAIDDVGPGVEAADFSHKLRWHLPQFCLGHGTNAAMA